MGKNKAVKVEVPMVSLRFVIAIVPRVRRSNLWRTLSKSDAKDCSYNLGARRRRTWQGSFHRSAPTNGRAPFGGTRNGGRQTCGRKSIAF